MKSMAVKGTLAVVATNAVLMAADPAAGCLVGDHYSAAIVGGVMGLAGFVGTAIAEAIRTPNAALRECVKRAAFVGAFSGIAMAVVRAL
jgi:hypothetical protein